MSDQVGNQNVGFLKTRLIFSCTCNSFEQIRRVVDDTVKFLNFRTLTIFALSYLKFKQSGQTLGYCVKMVQRE